jgi:predicted HTH domain antitoxin
VWLRTQYVDRRLSFKAIARLAGCSDTTVATYVRLYGIVRPERVDLARDVVNRAVSMYVQDHMSIHEVATSLGLSRDSVSELLLREGVRLRGRGARPTENLDAGLLRTSYEDGASIRQLANEAQAGDRAVKAVLARSGVAVRGRGRIPIWNDVLTPAFLQQQAARGHGPKQIAEVVGCSYTTARLAMRQHGLTHPKRP